MASYCLEARHKHAKRTEDELFCRVLSGARFSLFLSGVGCARSCPTTGSGIVFPSEVLSDIANSPSDAVGSKPNRPAQAPLVHIAPNASSATPAKRDQVAR